MTDILSQMQALIDDAERAERVTLHVGSAIRDWMSHQATAVKADAPSIDALAGIPVVVDSTMGGGRWELRHRSGAVVKSGGIGGPGETVVFFAEVGFIAFRLDDISRMAGLGPTIGMGT